MASTSEKQAHLFYRIVHGMPVEEKYHKIKMSHAQTMHKEDVAKGVFFDKNGTPRYNVSAPRSKDEMEADANG